MLRRVTAVIGVGVLAGTFLVSGMTKVLWSHAFERALRQYPVALSVLQTKAILVYLPLAELALAAGVLIKPLRRVSLYAMLFLLVAFTVLQIDVIALGLKIPCGCFGAASPPIGYRTVATNVILIVTAVWVLLAPQLEVQEHV